MTVVFKLVPVTEGFMCRFVPSRKFHQHGWKD
jgi:hypothetical protein